MNDALNPKALDPERRLLDRVKEAWTEGPEARRYYRGLLDVAAKYDRWAREAKSSPWLTTPTSVVTDALAGRRWEALRPLLLPMARSVTDLGWYQPEDDAIPWRLSEARSYEWLVLMKWLANTPTDVDIFDVDWVADQVGAATARQWRVERGDTIECFHGQYRYDCLRPPRLAGVPTDAERMKIMAARLSWEAAGQNGADILDFIRSKEALLADLLQLMLEADNGKKLPIAVDWFVCGARWFPFLTALKPVRNGNAVEVMTERDNGPENPLACLREIAERAGDPMPQSLSQAIYWYQIRYLSDAAIADLSGRVMGGSSKRLEHSCATADTYFIGTTYRSRTAGA
ncbi:MAG: hypothetical protein ACYTG0_11820 [Planctomycetota bacterium]